ncbi:MAG: hypothetical protein KDA24_29740 [Deltaproteobacteria bacterium]|nr:hypothetical protein [Deltaproteobacteria bacterium]
MLIIRHRINTADALAQVPPDQGVEVDLRCDGGELVLRHDAVGDGERFADWLAGYRHALLIANVKEEGLEELVLAALAERGVTDFFFLDQSVPFLVKTTARGEKRCAVRVSEYESTQLATKLAGKAKWIWLDCFREGGAISAVDAGLLKAFGYRICVVSPELHRADRQGEVAGHARWARSIGAHAVCTKLPELWDPS